jgi:hypothetical protein
MKTLLKLGAAAVLAAVFAGASASETMIDEIVVIGKRPATVLPRIEVARPVIPQLSIEPIAPVIMSPAGEVASAPAQDRLADAGRT